MARIDWIDRWKGLLIVLVVAGHVFGGACHLCLGVSQSTMEYLYKLIYMFHMPAFFWLAGLCWKTTDSSWRVFAARKAQRLLVPYVLFGVASAVAYILMDSGGNLFATSSSGYYDGLGGSAWWQPFASLLHGGGWPNGEGFRCNSVLWFLPAMFSVACFYWLVDRIMPNRWIQLLLAGMMLALEFVHRKWYSMPLPMGLSYIPWYGSFVILGRWMPIDRVRLPAWALAVSWLGFGLLVWLEPNYYLGRVRFLWYFVFFIMAVGGICLSAWSAKVIAWPCLAKCGQASLGIMLLHKFVVLFFQVKLPWVVRSANDSSVLFCLLNVGVLALSVVISWGATAVIRKVAPWTIGEVRK